jgi:hypothetical protein
MLTNKNIRCCAKRILALLFEKLFRFFTVKIELPPSLLGQNDCLLQLLNGEAMASD